jgi:hypothetical protein
MVVVVVVVVVVIICHRLVNEIRAAEWDSPIFM